MRRLSRRGLSEGRANGEARVRASVAAHGPMIAAPQSPQTPPVMCTTPEPAKSTTPPSSAAGLLIEIQPELDHAQWTTTG